MVDPEIEFKQPSGDWSEFGMSAGVLTMEVIARGVSGPIALHIDRHDTHSRHLVTANGQSETSETFVLPSDWTPGEYQMVAEGRMPDGRAVSAHRRFRLLPRGSGTTMQTPRLNVLAPRGQLKLPKGSTVTVRWETTAFEGDVRFEVTSGLGATLHESTHRVSVRDFDEAVRGKAGQRSFAIGPSWASEWHKIKVSIAFRDGGYATSRTDEASLFVMP
jgi:hypothetical protein